MNKTALIFGATGLIGSHLLEIITNESNFGVIKVFSRRPLNLANKRAEVVVVDFENEAELLEKVRGDVIFCCIGTTISKAKTQEAFRKVDFDIPVMLAGVAEKNSIKKMIVISSLGADETTSNFYLRTKGEMEKAVSARNIPEAYFLRPSLLLGPRKEVRPGEAAGKVLMKILSPFFVGKWKKYRPIEAKTVAQAMVKLAKEGSKEKILESNLISDQLSVNSYH